MTRRLTINTFISGLGAVAGLFAAYWWLQASLVDVPNNLDTFILALQLASQLNAYGAFAAMIGALCAAFLFARQII